MEILDLVSGSVGRKARKMKGWNQNDFQGLVSNLLNGAPSETFSSLGSPGNEVWGMAVAKNEAGEEKAS